MAVLLLARRRLAQAIAAAPRDLHLAPPAAAIPATVRRYSLLTNRLGTPSPLRGRLPQLRVPRAGQHVSAEDFAEGLDRTEEMEKYLRKRWWFLYSALWTTFGVMFVGMHTIPAGSRALKEKRTRLDGELLAAKQEMESLESEIAAHTEFMENNKQ